MSATSYPKPSSIRDSAILESSPSNFSKLSARANQSSFSIRSSAIFLWSSPSNFSKLSARADQSSFLIRSSAIFLWSSPSNFSKFTTTSYPKPFSIRDSAIFWWLTPLDFPKILSISKSSGSSEKSSGSSECDIYSNISFAKSSGIFSFADIYSALSLSFSSTILAARLPMSPSWRLAFRTWARSSLYFCWSGVRFLIRGCSLLISGLMYDWLFIFLLTID